MHSGAPERVNTPRRRTLSRGMSEDESLRHIRKEAESSARRLSRADSRMGFIKKLDRGESQSEDDLVTRLPEMLELQEAYSEAMQELRQLELHQEVLIFQVGCLQDALEGAEEMLAEAQREASDANAELERERLEKRKLEVTLGLLMQEMEKLKEERVAVSAVPVYTKLRNSEQESNIDVTDEGMRNEERDNMGHASLKKDLKNGISVEEAPLTVVCLETMSSLSNSGNEEGTKESPNNVSSQKVPGGMFSSFFRKGKEEEPSVEEGSFYLPSHGTSHLESSVDSDDADNEMECKKAEELKVSNESPLAKFQRIVHKTFAQMPSLTITTSPSQDGIFRNQVNQDDVSQRKEVVREASAEQTDAVPHVDALSEGVENIPDAGTLVTQPQSCEEPDRAEVSNEDNGVGLPQTLPEEPLSQENLLDTKNLKNPESCALS